MNKITQWTIAVLALAGLASIAGAVLVFGFAAGSRLINVQEQEAARYADNPAMLYQTVGIKDCDDEGYRYKGKHSGAVELLGDDLKSAIVALKNKMGENVVVALFVYSPEPVDGRPGQPALVVLKRHNGTYCVIGVVGSYSSQLLLEFEEKYQSLIQR